MALSSPILVPALLTVWPRVANLVIVAAQQEIMSQDKFHDCSMVEFFRKNSVQPCVSSSSVVAGASVVGRQYFVWLSLSRQTQAVQCSIPLSYLNYLVKSWSSHPCLQPLYLHPCKFHWCRKVSSLIYSILCNRLPFQDGLRVY